MTVRQYFFIVIGVIYFLVASCSNPYLEQDATKRKKTHLKFLKQKELAKNRASELFSVFDSGLSDVEQEALEFLYAYMPITDLANYDQEFYLAQVRYALKARSEFRWGETVPSDIFLHFVLPYRVNNEDMDSARMVFYRELKDRIKDMSMYDAALEVNHWCHEKVSYQSADIRTSGPLSTVRTAYGRCGEESTFTVTAMRAVGIPARQIYTPRWAHSDDNHAWVEVWVDGEWYFLGACEPQPELDMGWFAGPATRAMLLHTRVFGDYTTTDDVVNVNEKYTELNVLPDYAPAKRLFVKVVDGEGNMVDGAKVEFQLYNYAEFYPLAKMSTDAEGVCSLLTGYGDLVIWASNNNQIAFKKVSVQSVDTLELILENYKDLFIDEEFALVPPKVGTIAEASEEGIAENTMRLHKEDSIRSAYESTFIDSSEIVTLSKELNLDINKTYKIFKDSRGNWKVLKDFLIKYSALDKEKSVALLSVIADKDRRDVRYNVLVDHFNNSSLGTYNKEIFTNYILNPRIKNELLTPYKEGIQKYFGEGFIKDTKKDVSVLMNWIKDSIKIVTTESTTRNPMWPDGVLKLKVADNTSRNIFLVACLRSFGIPSRLEESRAIPQMWSNNEWIDLSFETLNISSKPKGKLTLKWTPKVSGEQAPKYYLQFTIAKFNGSTFNTLDYEFSRLFDSYPAQLELETGQYMLVTGSRQPDGTVWVSKSYFEIEKGCDISIPIKFASTILTKKAEIKTVKLNYNLSQFDSENVVSLKQLNSNDGIVIVWADPDREPTKHLVNDLIRLKEAYESWNGKVVIAIEPTKITHGFNLNNYKNLPNNAVFFKDENDIRTQFLDKAGLNELKEYPLVFVLNSKEELIYHSSGYKIGVGDEIISNLNTYCRID